MMYRGRSNIALAAAPVACHAAAATFTVTAQPWAQVQTLCQRGAASASEKRASSWSAIAAAIAPLPSTRVVESRVTM